jgi:cyclic beta-1,2-glucan synthetase
VNGRDEPIRAELFDLERLEQHAESLAARAVAKVPQQGLPLIPRVIENGRVLLDSYRAIAGVRENGGKSTHAVA